jgi:hypothetical protein
VCGRPPAAAVPGALHGRGAVTDLELGVDPAEMRADRVHRDGQLAGDLRPGQVRRQIPQHSELARAEFLDIQRRGLVSRRGWEPLYAGWLPFWLPARSEEASENPLTSAPGRIRTRDPLLRRQLLCPAELRALGDHCGRRISRLGHVQVAVCCSSDRCGQPSLRIRRRPYHFAGRSCTARRGRTTASAGRREPHRGGRRRSLPRCSRPASSHSCHTPFTASRS